MDPSRAVPGRNLHRLPGGMAMAPRRWVNGLGCLGLFLVLLAFGETRSAPSRSAAAEMIPSRSGPYRHYNGLRSSGPFELSLVWEGGGRDGRGTGGGRDSRESCGWFGRLDGGKNPNRAAALGTFQARQWQTPGASTGPKNICGPVAWMGSRRVGRQDRGRRTHRQVRSPDRRHDLRPPFCGRGQHAVITQAVKAGGGTKAAGSQMSSRGSRTMWVCHSTRDA